MTEVLLRGAGEGVVSLHVFWGFEVMRCRVPLGDGWGCRRRKGLRPWLDWECRVHCNLCVVVAQRAAAAPGATLGPPGGAGAIDNGRAKM